MSDSGKSQLLAPTTPATTATPLGRSGSSFFNYGISKTSLSNEKGRSSKRVKSKMMLSRGNPIGFRKQRINIRGNNNRRRRNRGQNFRGRRGSRKRRSFRTSRSFRYSRSTKGQRKFSRRSKRRKRSSFSSRRGRSRNSSRRGRSRNSSRRGRSRFSSRRGRSRFSSRRGRSRFSSRRRRSRNSSRRGRSRFSSRRGRSRFSSRRGRGRNFSRRGQRGRFSRGKRRGRKSRGGKGFYSNRRRRSPQQKRMEMFYSFLTPGQNTQNKFLPNYTWNETWAFPRAENSLVSDSRESNFSFSNLNSTSRDDMSRESKSNASKTGKGGSDCWRKPSNLDANDMSTLVNCEKSISITKKLEQSNNFGKLDSNYVSKYSGKPSSKTDIFMPPTYQKVQQTIPAQPPQMVKKNAFPNTSITSSTFDTSLMSTSASTSAKTSSYSATPLEFQSKQNVIRGTDPTKSLKVKSPQSYTASKKYKNAISDNRNSNVYNTAIKTTVPPSPVPQTPNSKNMAQSARVSKSEPARPIKTFEPFNSNKNENPFSSNKKSETSKSTSTKKA